ncbi:DUF2785 domain-containing protein [Nocardioides euryhalodurans]|uniref:DUF2785 domain-containing protein n=1 Tax=Nocardioides euryhalodurans TaxID=2518370 RepID=A0A4P7GIH3_9ACTN|nr:DUF2785 domain-containing protein [Nocardioides euryhalodurans]QBR91760.1 DUF2785 domain-containing protein [Nocardioides euryhalodurans]
MARSYWKQVLERGLQVPTDRPLDDLTAELTTMLGSPDPVLRDGTAYPALGTWIDRGVYDDLLVGLGDGMAAGLAVGLGESGTDTVFRRAFSVLVLATVVERDSSEHLLPADQVLRWGDRVVSWLLRERDLRGYVPGKGWAHAVAHGADAMASLAASRHFGATELTVLLDVLADRVLLDDAPLVSGEPDRLAHAVLAVLRRDLVPLKVVEPWVARLAARGNPFVLRGDLDPYHPSHNAQQLLRSLYLQLAIAPEPPADKADLVLVMVDALKSTNPFTLAR